MVRVVSFPLECPGFGRECNVFWPECVGFVGEGDGFVGEGNEFVLEKIEFLLEVVVFALVNVVFRHGLVLELLLHLVVGFERDGFAPGLARFVRFFEGGIDIAEMVEDGRVRLLG